MKYILLLSLLLLSGCQQLAQSKDTCVQLYEGVSQCLAPLPWQAMPEKVADDMAQLVSLTAHKRHHELTMSLEFSAQQMTVVGLAPLGQPLFTIQFDGHTLDSEQSMLLGEQFRADYLLALMQLIYWPKALLSQHIQGAELTQTSCGNADCRQLRQGEVLVANIEYQQPNHWHSAVVLTLPQTGIQLTIKPL